MPAGLPSSLLKTVGTLIQKSFQTNTAKEMIEDSVSICINRSRGYHIARLSTTVVIGGGCAALFVVEPTVSSYFVPIVEQGLPFLGTVATKVAIGIVGYWLGGAFGSCTIKAIEKEITFQKKGFRNPRLNFTEEDLKKIVKKNPHFFSPTGTEPSSESIEAVRKMLEQARDQIETFREEQKLDDKRKYKKALLEAIYKGNLTPLTEVISATLAEQETSNRITVQTVQYMETQTVPAPLSDQRDQALTADQPLSQETSPFLAHNSIKPTEEKKDPIELHTLSRGPNQPGTIRLKFPSKQLSEVTNFKLGGKNQTALLFAHQRQNVNLRQQAQTMSALPPQMLGVLPVSPPEVATTTTGQKLTR